ncbi:hypothetical protein M011DRAFT_407262 [Sporormia fimetaria CBS 119925]|uniref:Uncharacterized protein n=1 Tax=Sporormia fimetaria CBS 119925 TaxID=1340428 RepID=A0A6A6V4U5_9PLEO|nr:hypothetical protein M011DRAFT_407262 [Sporormia fimetaria CBS 119925]
MDEPARKRRRTASPNANGQTTSPLKQRPRRPSFASPTKASLARFNPNLLPRKPSAPEAFLTRGKQARAFILAAQANNSSEGPRAAEQNVQTSAGAEEGQASTTKIGMQPSGESWALHDAEEEEELPMEPGSQDLEHDIPRRGILFSSPSKRPPRRATRGGSSKADDLEQTSKEHANEEGAVDVEGVQGLEKDRRGIPDPELESKKREKEKLLRELEQLKADISQSVETIDKLNESSGEAYTDQMERDNLISFINKICDADHAIEEEPKPSLSNLLCSFLPYTALPVHPPKVEDFQKENVASHDPVDLPNPLPYLQMFTSLHFTPRLTLLRTPDSDLTSGRLHQKLSVDIEGPQKLFASFMETTVDPETLQVIDLRIIRLSNWAEGELGRFIRKKAKQNELGCVTWAMDSYWTLATKRAAFWDRCETTFSRLIPGRTSDDTENLIPSRTKTSANMTRKDLLWNLRRSTFVLQDKHAVLKLSWRISFDWTGEAESSVYVEPAYPSAWADADTAGSLKKIPRTFSSLVDRGGVFEATRVMVALLFPE